MNSKRREKLKTAHVYLNEAHSIVDNMYDEETDALDNMPENLQGSDRYEYMEECAQLLYDAASSIESSIDALEEVIYSSK